MDPHYPIINTLLDTAIDIAKRGDDDDQAERVFIRALDIAKMKEGEKGFLVGCILLELMDFYDERGRVQESDFVWKEIIDIVRVKYAEFMEPKQG